MKTQNWNFKDLIFKTTLQDTEKDTMEIFVGYSTRNGSKVYRMLNLTNQSIIISSDISWMNVNYVKWKSRVKNAHDPTSNKEQFINDNDDH